MPSFSRSRIHVRDADAVMALRLQKERQAQGLLSSLRAYAQRHGRLPPEARRTWPHPYLRDLLGDACTGFTDTPEEQIGQLPLI